MHEKPRYQDDLLLVALPSAVSCARMFVHHTLAGWNVGPFVLGDALVITHELVTLSVTATGVPKDRDTWSKVTKLNHVVTRVLGFSQHVVIEVWDCAKTPATLPSGEPTRPRTGLTLVDSVAHEWASVVTPAGRLTWAEIAVYDRTDSGLPIRQAPPAWPPAQPQATLSAELLHRVRDGLIRW